MENRKRFYKTAVDKMGHQKLLVAAIEEMSEFQKEICKYLCHKGKNQDFINELADVSIMLEQIAFMFGIEDKVNAAIQERVQNEQKRSARS